jgi:membrane-bound serine protease (ClpP class)
LLLFNSSVPSARVSPWLLAVVALALALFFGSVVSAVVRARRLVPAEAGFEGIVGEEGSAVDELDPRGRVRVRRESWSAESVGGKIPAGSPVRVVRAEGLRLIVEPVGATPPERGPEVSSMQGGD